jgi:ESS family glutamate:Na+ symporter
MTLTVELDLIQTLALGALTFGAGLQMRKRIPVLASLNIPPAVIGGLLVALLALLTHDRLLNLTFDTSAQPLFMVAFFATIGMGASLGLLRRGGAQVVIFLIMSILFCFVQNFLGMWIAKGFGLNSLVGVIAGSVTLVGGPATGMAFAPLFEEAGVTGAGVLAITSATFGIVCGGIIGGPIGTWLIRRHHRTTGAPTGQTGLEPQPDSSLIIETEKDDSPFILNLLVLGVTMGLGSIVSSLFQSLGLTLPAYIGAMIVASVIRNVDDRTQWIGLQMRGLDFVGGLALNIFLVVALMNLKLWELANLALPLALILLAQVAAVALFSLTVGFWVMGRDYDSAVMASGFIGFTLGTTANAMANMQTLTGRFGPSPRAFLVVPIVGAFFIDFANALIISGFLNWLK